MREDVRYMREKGGCEPILNRNFTETQPRLYRRYTEEIPKPYRETVGGVLDLCRTCVEPVSEGSSSPFFRLLMRWMTLSNTAQSTKNATTARAHTMINSVTILPLLRLQRYEIGTVLINIR